MIDDVIVGDDVAVAGDEEARALSHGQMLMMRSARAAVAALGHAEVAEEALERAARGQVRHGARRLILVGRISIAAVAHFDLDRNDRSLHAVDDIGERSRSRGGLRGLGERALRREGVVTDHADAEDAERDSAHQGVAQAPVGGGGIHKGHLGSDLEFVAGNRRLDGRQYGPRPLTPKWLEDETLVMNRAFPVGEGARRLIFGNTLETVD